MPSDCQCSACGACDCQSTRIVEKRLDSKEIIKMIEELEEKNRLLEEENKILLEENRREKVNKDEIISQLIKKLEEL
jgi:hypothetical protein